MVSHPHRLISDVMVERVPAAMDNTVYEWGGGVMFGSTQLDYKDIL